VIARIPDRTPVLVGVGLVDQREPDPALAREPLELMVAAAEAAGSDCGVPRLLHEIDVVHVPKGRWHYRDPGRAIAERVGSARAHTVLARVGVLQEQLVATACDRILAGDLDVALVVGGEAGFRLLRSRITGQEVVDSQQETEADEAWRASEVLMTEAEMSGGLGRDAPAYYAVLDSALRSRRKSGLLEHRSMIAGMYSGFSRVAAENPHAWRRTVTEPAEIRDPSAKNPMLAFPYTKMHTSDWSVDQATALLLCSAGKATELGVPPARWVHPVGTAASNSMTPVSERATMDRSPGAEIAARRVLDHAGVTPSDLDFVELYSCFPVAVLHHAEALGIGVDPPPTVSGGMRFAGGPFNNFVLHTTAQLAQRLRSRPGSVGLVSSVSGVLTKHAFSVWSSSPSASCRFLDVTDEATRATGTKTLDTGYRGGGAVAGYTVHHAKGEAVSGVAVVDTDTGDRALARTDDPGVLAAITAHEFTGHRVDVDDGRLVPHELPGDTR
jgi:acetyl-CoA C-acetyltransferase